MPAQEIEIRAAKSPCRHNVISSTRAQDDSADEPRRTRPADYANHDYEQKEGLFRADVKR